MSTPGGAPNTSWVRELVRPRPARTKWDLALLTAIAVGLPAGIPLIFFPDEREYLGFGVLISIGALITSISDRGGANADRMRRVGITALGTSLGFAVGSLAYGDDVARVLVVTTAALVSGLGGILTANISHAGLQFLVTTVIGSGISFDVHPGWLGPVLVLIGAGWRFLLTLLSTQLTVRTRRPERTAVATVYRALATELEASGTPRSDSARHALTTALNDAYDMVIAARTHLAGRDASWRRTVTLLNAATPIVEAATLIAGEPTGAPAESIRALRAIAASIDEGRPLPPLPAPDRSTPGRSRLSSALRPVGVLLGAEKPATTLTVPIQSVDARSLPQLRLREHARSFLDQLISGGETWSAVLRLVLCVAVAEALSILLPVERSYWIALTVAVAMKPDFGSVFARAMQRGLGTVVGVFIGAAVVVGLPMGWPQLIALAVLAGMLPVAIKRNYGMLATFLTPVIVILLELVHTGDTGLIVARVTDTLIGCAIVLFVGYLPWPSTWHTSRHIGARVADVALDVAGYLDAALGGKAAGAEGASAPDASQSASAVRRATYRRLSDLRTLVQQTLAEPPPASTAAAAWWPEIVALERVTGAITSTRLLAEHAGTRADAGAVRELQEALRDLSLAVRSGTPPRTLDLPSDELLLPVSDEIRSARALLAG